MNNAADKSVNVSADLDAGDAGFATRASSLLRESAEHLDGRTLSRLTRARHAALDSLQSGSARSSLLTARWLAPAGGLAAVALVAVVWFGAPGAVDPVVPSAGLIANAGASPLEDLALMADTESLELLEEIEFYAWLDAESDLPAAGGDVG